MFDTSRMQGRRDASPRGDVPKVALEPYYVKPSRAIEVAPATVCVADAITADLVDAELIESAVDDVHSDVADDAGDELAEGRRAPRKSQILPAYITAVGMSNVIPSRVLDMSATGAKIELTPMGRATGIPMNVLPERFILVLRHDKMEVDCETVWRDEWLVGVRFLGFPRMSHTARR